MIHRCVSCHRLIWPWQRLGWYVVSDSITVWKHGRCPWPEHGWWMGT